MISIINFGVGNIKAFYNIYKKLGHDVQVVSDSNQFIKASKLILPGVGNFDYTLKKFKNSNLFESVNKLVLYDKMPLLGICVGMQMLAKSSEEGNEKGLSWIDSEVKKFKINTIKYKPHVPHMGWNNVNIKSNNKLFNDLPEKVISIFYILIT